MNEEIDYGRINKTLKAYPKLFEIFGIKLNRKIEICTQCNALNEEYTFYGILNSPDYSDEDVRKAIEEYENALNGLGDMITVILANSDLKSITWKRRFLGRLDYLCKKLNHLYSNKKLRDGINNNVFNFLSELEFAEYCISNSIKILEVEPKLNTKKNLDFKIEIENTPVLVEVITPRTKLEIDEGIAMMVSGSRGHETNVNEELEHHEIENNELKEPFIIVINGDYAGIVDFIRPCIIEEFCKRYKNESRYLKSIWFKAGNRYDHFEVNNKIVEGVVK